MATKRIPKVRVPDVPGVVVRLCYAQDRKTFVRCDRAEGHKGRHSWQLYDRIEELHVKVLDLEDALEDCQNED